MIAPKCPTYESACDAHNVICGIQHFGVLTPVLHAAVDAGKYSMAREDEGAQAKGDWQAVQVQRSSLCNMDPTSNKIVHHNTCISHTAGEG